MRSNERSRLIKELQQSIQESEYGRAAEVASRLQVASTRIPPQSIIVTVILQYYRHPGLLFEICSRLEHPHVEVVIHADSYTVQDEAAFDEVLAKFTTVRIVRSHNIHEVRGYNKVAAHFARGTLLVFTQDDRLPPMQRKWIDTTIRLFHVMPRYFAALSLHRGNLYVVRSHWSQDYGACLDMTDQPIATQAHRDALVYVGSATLGPLITRKDVFLEVGGFNETFSPPGRPGIKFDQEFVARLWTHGYQAAAACASKATHFRNGCGGSMTSATKEKRRERWSQAATNTALLKDMYETHLEGAILERVLQAQQRLADNKWLYQLVRKLLPGCVNCTAEPRRASRMWSRHDSRICYESINRTFAINRTLTNSSFVNAGSSNGWEHTYVSRLQPVPPPWPSSLSSPPSNVPLILAHRHAKRAFISVERLQTIDHRAKVLCNCTAGALRVSDCGMLPSLTQVALGVLVILVASFEITRRRERA